MADCARQWRPLMVEPEMQKQPLSGQKKKFRDYSMAQTGWKLISINSMFPKTGAFSAVLGLIRRDKIYGRLPQNFELAWMGQNTAGFPPQKLQAS